MEHVSKTNILPDIFLRKRNQNKNARTLQINTMNRNVESCYVSIGGIDQWVTIRGEDCNNPIFLYGVKEVISSFYTRRNVLF
jgi:hypothetical protein